MSLSTMILLNAVLDLSVIVLLGVVMRLPHRLERRLQPAAAASRDRQLSPLTERSGRSSATTARRGSAFED